MNKLLKHNSWTTSRELHWVRKAILKGYILYDSILQHLKMKKKKKYIYIRDRLLIDRSLLTAWMSIFSLWYRTIVSKMLILGETGKTYWVCSVFLHASVLSHSAQLCPTLCHPTDYSLSGSCVHGILQARILDWVAIPFSSESSWRRDQTLVSCIDRRILYHWPTWEAYSFLKLHVNFYLKIKSLIKSYQAMKRHEGSLSVYC